MKKPRGLPRGRGAEKALENRERRSFEASLRLVEEMKFEHRPTYWDRADRYSRTNSQHIPEDLKRQGDECGVPAYAVVRAFRNNDRELLERYWKTILNQDAVRERRTMGEERGAVTQVDAKNNSEARRLQTQELAYCDRDLTAPVNEEEIIDTISFLERRDWRQRDSWPTTEWVRRYFGISRKDVLRISKSGRWGARDLIPRTWHPRPKRGRPVSVLTPRAVAKVLRHVAAAWPSSSEKALGLAKKLMCLKSDSTLDAHCMGL